MFDKRSPKFLDGFLRPGAVLCLVLLAVLAVRPAMGEEDNARSVEIEKMSAKQILDYIDDLFRGDSSYAKISMKVMTEHWSRELMLEAWSEGTDKTLVRILSPRKERGTATLKAGNDIWNYLPKVRRLIKLPSSMMGGSWMGSHFTNDDLVKDSRMAEDYDFAITFRGERDGVKVTEATCIPKEEAAVVWGKVVVRIRDRDVMPLLIQYYSEDMKLSREMQFSDFRLMGGRVVPALCRMVPKDKPKESTEVFYEEIDFNPKLDPDIFSLRRLQQ